MTIYRAHQCPPVVAPPFPRASWWRRLLYGRRALRRRSEVRAIVRAWPFQPDMESRWYE